MSTSSAEPSFIEEFRKFIEFLGNLWGVLAGISVFFPLSNVLVQAIPLAQKNEGALAYLSPQLVTAISTVACVFVVFWSFAQRRQITTIRKRRPVQKQAVFSFAIGLASLIVYLGVHFAAKSGLYFRTFGWLSEDPRWILSDIVLLLMYTAFFVLVTRAFVILGVLEYFGKKT